MEDLYCSECKIYTSIVYDHCAGDTICSQCGLVLKLPSIDNQTLLQTHNSKSVGSCTNPLVSSASLQTCGTIDGSAFVQWKKPMAREVKEDNKFSKVFKTMDEMADRLGLVDTIKDCAKEIYKKANEGKIILKYWKNHKATKVACLYLASQEEGLPRTLKEILTVADGTNVKDIHKVIQMLKGHLEVGRKTIRAKDIARRYCSTLGLNNYVIKAVQEILHKTEEFDIRRNYTSILASAIYMATQLSEKKINPSEIAKVCEVSEGTLKKTYKDIYPLSSVLIPSWYANAEDTKKVPPVLKSGPPQWQPLPYTSSQMCKKRLACLPKTHLIRKNRIGPFCHNEINGKSARIPLVHFATMKSIENRYGECVAVTLHLNKMEGDLSKSFMENLDTFLNLLKLIPRKGTMMEILRGI
ncbi:unnamed protein product [Lupinus luteus]|uniref:TFIIB-type domain-containing protein n=1 Tax=Lupinus luteus TaxID=3873 RepID=A0AAV1XCJ2_LUPLU